MTKRGPITMTVRVLSTIPASVAERLIDRIPEDALQLANAGKECVVATSDDHTEGVVIRFVKCKQAHPEVKRPLCRAVIVGKIEDPH